MFDRRLCAAALALVAVVCIFQIRGMSRFGVAAPAIAAEAKTAKGNGVDIAKQEIALAKEALQIATHLENQARADSNDVSVWSRRLVEATRKSGATKPEVVQAIKDHLARMDARVVTMKARVESARAVRTDVLNAQYDALEARAWLAAEQAE